MTSNLHSLTWIVILIFFVLFTGCGVCADNTLNNSKIIKDTYGREVTIPSDVERVVLLGTVYSEVAKILGDANRIVGVDSDTKNDPLIKVIVPEIESAKNVGSIWENTINMESIASLKPDLVVIRAWAPPSDSESRKSYDELIQKIETLNIPVIVMLDPDSYDTPDIKTLNGEIEILGEIFNKKDEAQKLIDYLTEKRSSIDEKTNNIPESEKKNVLLYATDDYMMGPETIQSSLLTNVVHANNALKEGGWETTSAEKIMALNPDVIIAYGHMGYIDPSIILGGQDYRGINWGQVKDLKAIKNGNVTSIGFTEWGTNMEMIIGLLKEAKGVYPDKFSEVNITNEEDYLYGTLFGLNSTQILKAKEAQKNTEDTD